MREQNLTREDTFRWVAVDSWAALRLERASRFLFGSQIDAINVLNNYGGRLLTEVLRPIYLNASTTFPPLYANYTFEQWLSYLTNNGLITIEGSDVVITPSGKAIVPYMQALGYLNIRPGG